MNHDDFRQRVSSHIGECLITNLDVRPGQTILRARLRNRGHGLRRRAASQAALENSF
jgi:hypothetical protein